MLLIKIKIGIIQTKQIDNSNLFTTATDADFRAIDYRSVPKNRPNLPK